MEEMTMVEVIKLWILGGPDRMILSGSLFSADVIAEFRVHDLDCDGVSAIKVVLTNVRTTNDSKTEFYMEGIAGEHYCVITYNVTKEDGWIYFIQSYGQMRERIKEILTEAQLMATGEIGEKITRALKAIEEPDYWANVFTIGYLASWAEGMANEVEGESELCELLNKMIELLTIKAE